MKKYRYLLLCMCVLFAIADYAPADTISEQQQAIMDAKRDVKRTDVSAWALGGCLLPGVAIIAASAITPPTNRQITCLYSVLYRYLPAGS